MERFDWRTIGPAAAVLAIMVVPLVVWSASSGDRSSTSADLTVGREPSRAGDPLLTVTIAERLNKPELARNGQDVKLECVDGEGRVVAQSTQTVPFPDEEPGYGAHAHQLVPGAQIAAVERCGLRGARVRLEAKLSG